MARIVHTVEVKLPACDLKADVLFNVKHDGKKIGTLKISTGSVTWLDARAKRGKRITWSELAEAIADSPKGAPEKRKKSSPRGR